MNTVERINFLRTEIAKHNIAYYDNDNPVISDYAYDQLVKELQQLEIDNPDFIVIDSPTRVVGGTPDKSLRQVKHSAPMLSLANIFDEDDIINFTKKVDSLVIAEHKIDGLSCALRYSLSGDKYILEKAITRGDGNIGEDITNNVKEVYGVENNILATAELLSILGSAFEVRGELHMRYSCFWSLNDSKDQDKQFANPRNATAGIVRRKTKKDKDLENVEFLAYFLLDNAGSRKLPNIFTQEEVLLLLRKMRFDVCPYKTFADNSEVPDYIVEVEEDPFMADIATDGIVLKVNDIAKCIELGAISKSPKWATAYKFPPEEAVSVLENVIWQVGRSGIIAPVAELRPTHLGGSTISRASLHNIEQIRRLCISIGDSVVIRKAAEIIPEIVYLDKQCDNPITIEVPTKCPVCGADVERADNETVSRCIGLNCSAKVKGQIELYASRDALYIDGLGPAIIDGLVDEEIIADIADLYTLTPEAIMLLPRTGRKMADKLVANISMSKTPELHKFIYGLGIRNTGQGTAKRLAEKFNTLIDIRCASVDDLKNVPDIGETTANSVHDYFESDYATNLMKKLQDNGVVVQDYGTAKVSAKFEGMTFVFTGSMSVERGLLEDEVMKRGGNAFSSVSKKTTYVVAGPGAGSKLTKAEALGITILDETEFMNMLGII